MKLYSNIPTVKQNLAYSLASSIINLGFPVLSFAYVSRIMGPEVLGRFNFASVLVAFFLIAASLAMPLYGVREIAKSRQDQLNLNQTFSELFKLNLLSTIFSLLLFIVFSFFSVRIQQDWKLFSIVGLNIFFNIFSVEWLYQGVENYLSVTLRNLCFKSISLSLVFCFVKTKSDILMLAGITVFANAGSALFGFISSRKIASLRLSTGPNFKKHLKPMATLSGSTLAASMYVYLDSVLLGYLAGNKAVGLFTAATRVVKISITLMQSLSMILIPRLSYYVKHGLKNEFQRLSEKSLSIIYFLSFPASGAMLVLSDRIIHLLSGKDFTEAIFTTQIVSPLLILMGFTNLIGIQVIFPNGGEKKLLYVTVFTALVNLLLNILLIPKYGANGTAAALMVTESCSVILLGILSYKSGLLTRFINKNTVIYFGLSVISSYLIWLLSRQINSDLIAIICGLIIGGSFYLSALWILKDVILMEVLGTLKNKLISTFNSK